VYTWLALSALPGPAPLRLRGRCALPKGGPYAGKYDFPETIRALRAALRLDPTLIGQYLNVAELHRRVKDVQAAEKTYQEALGDFCKRTSHLVLLVPDICSWPPPSGGKREARCAHAVAQDRLEGGNRGMRCAPVSPCQHHHPPPRLPPLGGGIAWEHLFWKSPKYPSGEYTERSTLCQGGEYPPTGNVTSRAN
jgi:hypothetical protein